MADELRDALLGSETPLRSVVVRDAEVIEASEPARAMGLGEGAHLVDVVDAESMPKLMQALSAADGSRTEIVWSGSGGGESLTTSVVVLPHRGVKLLLLFPHSGRSTELLYGDVIASNDHLVNLARELSRQRLQLEVAHAKLKDAAAQREEFLAVLSHDLRTPLTSIGLQAGLIDRRAEVDAPADLRRRAKTVSQSARTLLGILSTILDSAKLDAEQVTLELAEVSLREVADEVCQSLEAWAAEAGVQLRVRGQEGDPWPVRADRSRLWQVVANLMENAIRHSPPDGEVTISARVQDGFVRCEVEDQGPGVPPEERELIFERFHQGTRRKGAAGLGLSIVQRVVDLHGGRIHVEAGASGGARFVFTVPSPSGQG